MTWLGNQLVLMKRSRFIPVSLFSLRPPPLQAVRYLVNDVSRFRFCLYQTRLKGIKLKYEQQNVSYNLFSSFRSLLFSLFPHFRSTLCRLSKCAWFLTITQVSSSTVLAGTLTTKLCGIKGARIFQASAVQDLALFPSRFKVSAMVAGNKLA